MVRVTQVYWRNIVCCLAVLAQFSGLALVMVIGLDQTKAQAQISSQQPARQPSKKPVSISIFVSSDANGCYEPGLVRAIKQFTRAEAERINAAGGIAGHPLDLRIADDFSNSAKTVANVSRALSNERLLAMIGVSSSTRGKALFDAIGQQIGASNVPFITEISLNRLFAPYGNVFTLASSVDNQLDVLATFIGQKGFKRPAFVGLKEHLYVKALGDGMKARLSRAGLGVGEEVGEAGASKAEPVVANVDANARSDTPTAASIVGTGENATGSSGDSNGLVADIRVKIDAYVLKQAQGEQIAAELKAAQPDVLLLGIGSGAGGQLLKYLANADLKIPVFIVYGRISRMLRRAGTIDPNWPFFQFAWDGVPNAYNERLRQRIWRAGTANWLFDDTPVAPGSENWRKQGCEITKKTPLAILDDRNRRAIGRGAQYRDMLALIAEAAKNAPGKANLAQLRAHIVARISRYSMGRQVSRGWWRDWSFTRNRTSAADTLIVSRPSGDSGIVLADQQYARVNGKLEPRPVVYFSLDLISISRIETNDKSFDAEFYLSLKSKDPSINITSIDFTNAYRSQAGHKRLVSWREIHNGDAGTNFPKDVKLYKVSGKFTFHPNLSHYPFDTQRLSISFQPASTAQPFLIQPPTKAAREGHFELDGWQAKDQYVGSDQDIIPTIDKHVSEKRIVPFYKFNYSWVVRRIAVDYFQRVVVPLGFILLVTYFSIFLTHNRFESIMGIQVTALLSAIALYLALPKIDSDQATLSDKIFMITYAGVSFMIGLSILKDSRLVARLRGVRAGVSFVQIVVFPIVAFGVIGYLIFGAPTTAVLLAEQLSSFWQSGS